MAEAHAKVMAVLLRASRIQGCLASRLCCVGKPQKFFVGRRRQPMSLWREGMAAGRMLEHSSTCLGYVLAISVHSCVREKVREIETERDKSRGGEREKE